jgi:TRAP-type C4-dicarboxylate transport system, periplasmic component
MKRRILLLSALAMLGAATLPAHAADKIIVKIAGMKPDGEPETVGMKLFAKYVMEAPTASTTCASSPNSQLGKEDAYIAQTRKGIIQMCATGPDGSIFPAMAMLETPMLYDNLEHAHRAMNGEPSS